MLFLGWTVIFFRSYVGKFHFGKYHRGNGIQCKAYLVNVRSILSTLKAFAELYKPSLS
jgi:hypothetical protein